MANHRTRALRELGLRQEQIKVDLFASPTNTHEALFCTKENSAWRYDWQRLVEKEDDVLWSNPPFTKIERVLTKVALEGVRMAITTPDWGSSGAGRTGHWRRLLDRMTIDRVYLPDEPLYRTERTKKLLPGPQWTTMVSLIDGRLMRKEELDPSVARMVKRMCKGWGLPELRRCLETRQRASDTLLPLREVFPKVEASVQTSEPCQPFKKSEESKDQESLADLDLSPISKRSNPDLDTSASDMRDFLAEIGNEVEKEGSTEKEEESPSIMLLQFGGGQFSEPTGIAKPSTKHPISPQDLDEMGREWHHRPEAWLHVVIEQKEQEERKSDILHGEFEADLQKLGVTQELEDQLKQFHDVFGALPQPGEVTKVVTMDLQLKPE